MSLALDLVIVCYTLFLHCICVPFAERGLIFSVLEVIHLFVAEVVSELRRSKVMLVILQKHLLCRQLSHFFSILTLAYLQLLLLAGLFPWFISGFFIVVSLLYFFHNVLFVPLASCLVLSSLNPFELFLSTGVCKLHSVSSTGFINAPFTQA